MRIVSVAPFATGSPTSVLGLSFSLALKMTLRFSGKLGPFTIILLPRMVWSAA